MSLSSRYVESVAGVRTSQVMPQSFASLLLKQSSSPLCVGSNTDVTYVVCVGLVGVPPPNIPKGMSYGLFANANDGALFAIGKPSKRRLP